MATEDGQQVTGVPAWRTCEVPVAPAVAAVGVPPRQLALCCCKMSSTVWWEK